MSFCLVLNAEDEALRNAPPFDQALAEHGGQAFVHQIDESHSKLNGSAPPRGAARPGDGDFDR
jgi:hypothetical protein